jgi:hypothetical protein
MTNFRRERRIAVAKQKGEQAPQSALKRVTIRVPQDIHDALMRRREETGQSLNDLLVEAAAKFVGMPVPKIPKGIPGRKPGNKGRGRAK